MEVLNGRKIVEEQQSNNKNIGDYRLETKNKIDRMELKLEKIEINLEKIDKIA